MPVRILLVDDHPAYLERARALLELLDGAEVVGIALSGAEAITLAANLRPDLVLLDFQMPGLNGIETTRRLKASDPSLQVVIVTAHDDVAYRTAAASAGADGWIPKTEIADRIAGVLDAIDRGGAG